MIPELGGGDGWGCSGREEFGVCFARRFNLDHSRTSSRKCEACSRSTSCRGLTDTGVLKYVWGRQTRQVVEVEHDPHLQQMARE